MRHGRRDADAGLRDDLLGLLPAVLDAAQAFLDYPVVGSVLFAVAEWELSGVSDDRADDDSAERAVRLLVHADLFGYNRQLPSLRWAPAEELAERVRPGALARIRAEIGPRRAPELRDQVLALVAQLLPSAG